MMISKNINFLIIISLLSLSISLEEILEKKIIFQQPSESSPVRYILVHIPDKEIFMSTLHPSSSLFKDLTYEVEIKKCFDNLEKILKENNIELITVRSALKLNKTSLKELAFKALKYVEDDKIEFNKTSENYKKFKEYISDSYKNKIIEKLTQDQLVDIILTNPKYKLKPTNLNTCIEPSLISFNPLRNLIFCRAQQIITAKGVIIGRTRSSQYSREHIIMEQVFTNLNSDLLGILTEKYDKNAYLEGGDYFILKNDLSMLGVGLRTSIKGAEYLMENDFLGTRYLAIIYDNEDLDHQRMCLDTYFNILNDKYIIVLDFDEVQSHYNNKTIDRKVYLYDNNDDNEKGINSDDKNIPNFSGNYKLIKIYNKFYNFLEENGYELIKVTHQ